MNQAPPVSTEHGTTRLEAFSDGVLAVIITLMALDLRAPVGGSFHALSHRLPSLLIYVLSFASIGVYWNNHHHLLRATTRISSAIMWANLHLLFWLSLIPVVTEWVGNSYKSTAPAVTYSVVALVAALAYSLLVGAIVSTEGPTSPVARAIGRDLKGRLSPAICLAAVGFGFLTPWISYALLTTVEVMWFIPDRRLDR